MPIPLLFLAVGGVSFGAGFWSGSSANKLMKIGLVGGGCYLGYKAYKEYHK